MLVPQNRSDYHFLKTKPGGLRPSGFFERPAMNFLQLVQDLALQMDYTKPSTLDNADNNTQRLMMNVNRAYSHLWTVFNRRNEDAENETTVSTVANQNYIDAPYKQVDQVAVDNDISLRILPWIEFENLYRRSDLLIVSVQAGYPQVCSIYQRRIYLYPAPDSVYSVTVRGKDSLTELSSDTDTPALHPDMHRIIFEYALYLQMQYENNPQAQDQRAQAEQLIQETRKTIRSHNGLPYRVMSEDEFMPLDPYLRGANQ